MADTRPLYPSPLDPKIFGVLADVLEKIRRDLGLLDDNDENTILLARTIIEAAQAGERDPERIRELALKALSAQLLSKSA